MQTYKIIITDDHAIMRAGLKMLIERDHLLRVIAEAQDGEELLAKLKVVPCNLVILDLAMPCMNGLEALARIRSDFPKVKVIILTAHRDTGHFKKALKLKVSGYVLKEDSYDQLHHAIFKVKNGEKFFSPRISEFVIDDYVASEDKVIEACPEVLTRAEMKILKMIAAGYRNKDIALENNTSIRTVEVHRAHILKKLGASSTAALVKYALTNNIASH